MPYNAIAPNAALFKDDTARSNYLALLAAEKGDPTQAIADRFALMMEAKRGAGDNTAAYLAALKATNDQQAQQAAAETQADVAKAYLPTVAGNAKAGVGSAISMAANPYFSVNPEALATADTINLDATSQGAFKDRAAGTTDLIDSGVKIADPYIARSLAGPLDELPPEITSEYMSPAATTDRMKAQADVKAADASMVRANRELTSTQMAKMSYTPSAFGMPVMPTYRGTPAQVKAAEQAWLAANGQGGDATSAAPSGDANKRYILVNGKVVDNPHYKGKK